MHLLVELSSELVVGWEMTGPRYSVVSVHSLFIWKHNTGKKQWTQTERKGSRAESNKQKTSSHKTQQETDN